MSNIININNFIPKDNVLAYLNNELTEEEAIQFEEALETDFELQEALVETSETLILVKAAFAKEKNEIENGASSPVTAKVFNLNTFIQANKIYLIAATVVCCIVSLYFLFRVKDNSNALVVPSPEPKANVPTNPTFNNAQIDSLEKFKSAEASKKAKTPNHKPSNNNNAVVLTPLEKSRLAFFKDSIYRKEMLSNKKFNYAGNNSWQEEYDKGNYEIAKSLIEKKLKTFERIEDYPESECYYLGKIYLYDNKPDYNNAVVFLEKTETFRADAKCHLLTALLLSERFREAKEYAKNNPAIKQQLPSYLQKVFYTNMILN